VRGLPDGEIESERNSKEKTSHHANKERNTYVATSVATPFIRNFLK